MSHTERGNHGYLLTQKGRHSESNAEKSLADFFTKLSQTIDLLGKAPSKGENLQLGGFENYSQTFAGFAQNNVSKSEGFSIGVKLNQPDKYEELVAKLIKEKRAAK